MSERFVTRGFVGRRGAAPGPGGDVAVADPPGPVPDDGLPGAVRRPDAADAARPLVVLHRGPRREPVTLDLGRVPGAPEPATGRSTSAASRSGPSSTCAGAASASTRSLEHVDLDPTAAFVIAYSRRRLHHEPAARRRPQRPGVRRLGVRRQARSRRSTADRPASSCPARYFWKSAKWIRGLRIQAQRRARLLGVARLPQPRRPVARRALQRRLGTRLDGQPDRLAARDGQRRSATRRRPSGRSALARPGLAGAPARPARRPAADGRGRLQRRAELLDRLRAGADRRDRDHGRADRGRRGVAVPPRRRRARRPARGPRADRRLLRVGGGARRAAAPRRRRVRRGAADGDAPPSGPGRDRASRRGCCSARAHFDEIIYREELDRARGGGRRARGRPHADPVAAAGLDRLRAADRRADARRGPRAARRVGRRVHLRPDGARRGRGRTGSSGSACRRIASGPNASARPGRSRRRNRA